MNQNTQFFDAVLFDMDGVLADSEPHWNDIDAELLRGYGVTYNGEHKHEVLGKPFPPALTFYKNHYNLPAELEHLIEKRHEIAAQFYAQHINLFEDTKRVLASLHESGIKTAVATSSPRGLAIPFLQRHEIAAYFDVIVTGEEVQNGKPAPDIYLRAAQKVGVSPEKCLVVEDSLAGVAAGKAARMQVAAIPDARFVNVADYENRADFLILRLAEVLPIARGEK